MEFQFGQRKTKSISAAQQLSISKRELKIFIWNEKGYKRKKGIQKRIHAGTTCMGMMKKEKQKGSVKMAFLSQKFFGRKPFIMCELSI